MKHLMGIAILVLLASGLAQAQAQPRNIENSNGMNPDVEGQSPSRNSTWGTGSADRDGFFKEESRSYTDGTSDAMTAEEGDEPDFEEEDD